ncbi:helix-turn-helix domain-containing protein [Sulfoacidibacillus thermotolerans]|uniref:HTH cro/C1-type domain-containing protein n=1 Tax=Sulfoacidibacillus thermotolerans TaxID=1765684 RepID=A0A2U3D9B5_SULT2|nr:helix-turn-helix domain-containing protein [Sulfoacidibacillus thermotolerans]PWI57866.1 hypothetical protein BM613_06705 [Sulfoacidibacillus thermotolerans]
MDLVVLGRRLREARLNKGFTQQELADRCGFTKSMLSKIENGHSPAALATLSRIAKNLDLSLAWFLQEEEEENALVIVPADKRGIRSGSQEIGYTYETLSNRSRFSTIEPTVITVPAILENFELFTHDEDEFIFVLEGQISLLYDGTLNLMSSGDSAYFEGRKPHIFLPVNQQEAKVLTIFIQRNQR